MIECVQPYYIKDGEVFDCSSFHMGLINEGKSIYEVARLLENNLLFLDDHLDRFFLSLSLEGIHPHLSREEIKDSLERLLRKNQVKKGNIKFLLNITPSKSTHFLCYFVSHRYPSGDDYKRGVKISTFPFERSNPNKKVWRPEFRRQIASFLLKNKAFEALLLDTRGFVPEASKSNVFAIRKEILITPPDDLILPGITRKYVLECCRHMGIRIDKRTIHVDEIRDMDGLFLTGTSLHVLPVNQVDSMKIPVSNEAMRNIMHLFNKLIRNPITTTLINS